MSCGGAVAVQVPNSPIFSPPPLYKQTSPATIHGPEGGTSSVSREVPVPGFSVLKRKRPARIDIPVAPAVACGGLGFRTETPRGSTAAAEVEVEVEVEEGCYSVFCKRGRRGGAMEDSYSAFVDSKHAIFGVYDGHGGAKAAEFAASKLGKNIIAEATSGRCEEGIQKVVRNGYLMTDMEFLKQNVNGGACCVTALVHKGSLVVSNAGDCRAVISNGGVAEALTSDHQASREDERNRIEALGGYVDCCNGVWRIQGSLAVTRGIGDRHLKQWVIAEPETRVLTIRPECEFLILASDGLWDKVNDQEAVDIVRPLLIGIDKPEPLAACKKLTELSIRRGSIDDVSVMIIQLGHFIQ